MRRTRFHALDLAALQNRGSELNFHCQLDTEGLTVYDEFAEVALGYGVSFDAGEELQNIGACQAADLARIGVGSRSWTWPPAPETWRSSWPVACRPAAK